jgi:non-specific protein-tyrosine kinase
MANLLSALAQRCDIVILDTPPVLPVTDAVVLATQVDAVILVARYGRTVRHAAAEAARRLEAVGANVVGFVLNAIPPSDSRDYYADYSYSPKSKKSRRRSRGKAASSSNDAVTSRRKVERDSADTAVGGV